MIGQSRKKKGQIRNHHTQAKKLTSRADTTLLEGPLVPKGDAPRREEPVSGRNPCRWDVKKAGIDSSQRTKKGGI